jgi:hypothetical protein
MTIFLLSSKGKSGIEKKRKEAKNSFIFFRHQKWNACETEFVRFEEKQFFKRNRRTL